MRTANSPLAFIIEDDAKLTAIYSQAIKMAGFEIRQASNGQEAIDILADLSPALIVLDLHLPGATGDKVLACTRQKEHLKKTIVILTTANSIMADSLREQTDFVLLKPVSFGQLPRSGDSPSIDDPMTI